MFPPKFDLHKEIGEMLGVHGGLTVRQLEDPSSAGTFNHSFRNYYVSLDALGLWEGMKVSVEGDVWDAEGEDIFSAGFELEQEMRGVVRLRIGTNYWLYHLDPFTGRESSRNRRYYVKLRWHLLPRFDLDTGYEYEKDSITEYHVVTGGLRLWF